MSQRMRDYDPAVAMFLRIDGTYHSRMGRSTEEIECECGAQMTVYPWSFSGCGKRCDGCSRKLSHYAFVMSTEELEWRRKQWEAHVAATMARCGICRERFTLRKGRLPRHKREATEKEKEARGYSRWSSRCPRVWCSGSAKEDPPSDHAHMGSGEASA